MRRVIRRRHCARSCDVNHGAHQVALVAPQLQQAAPMRLAHRVVGSAHVEQNAAILKQRAAGWSARYSSMVWRQLLGRSDASLGEPSRRLPALPRAQAGNVRGVVARVPVVHGQRLGQSLAALLGMVVALLEVLFGHGFQQRHPAAMQRRQSSPAKLDGQWAVCQLGPGRFVIRLDGRPILGEGKLEADVGSWRGCRPRDAPPGAPSSRLRGRAYRAGHRSARLPPRAAAQAAGASVSMCAARMPGIAAGRQG